MSLGMLAGGPAPEHPPLELDDEEQSSLERRAARAAERGPKVTRVVAARPLLRQRLAELWRSRELFVFLVRKDIKVRYKNSFLGFLWSMLNPALNLLVYYVVFQDILKAGIPGFAIYLFSGLLAWQFFQTGVTGATSVVVGNAGIVKKVAFPREILALSSVGSAFMFFVFQAIVMLLFMAGFEHAPAWGALWLLVPAMAALVMFSSALAVFLSAVNVYLRDTQHLVDVAMTPWFWASPVVYSYNAQLATKSFVIHHFWVKAVYFLNPLAPVVMSFQRAIYARGNVNNTQTSVLAHWPITQYLWMDLAWLAISVLLFLGAMVVFGRLEGNFAEEL